MGRSDSSPDDNDNVPARVRTELRGERVDTPRRRIAVPKIGFIALPPWRGRDLEFGGYSEGVAVRANAHDLQWLDTTRVHSTAATKVGEQERR